MADPLAQVADDYAPAPLNFFDQKQAGDIISRYHTARQGYELESAVAKDRLAMDRGQFELEAARKREERDRLLDTREDQEYREKQEARGARSQFIGDLLDLDDNDPEIDDKIIGIIKDAPPAVQEDETVKDILRAKRDKAERMRQERERGRLAKESQDYGLKKVEMQRKNSELWGYLTPEDLATLPRDPETGQVDMEAGLSKAVQRKLEAKEGMSTRAFDRRANLARELAGKAADDRNMKFVFEDKEAFGDPKAAALEAAKAAVKDKNPKLVPLLTSFEKLKEIPGMEGIYEDAKDEMDNVVANEFNRALRMDREAYVNARGELSDVALAARGKAWDYAHRGDTGTKGEPAKTEPTKDAIPEKVKTLPKDGKKVVVDGKEYVVYPDGRIDGL